MAQPQLKLIYFDIPGKAEAIRLALYFQDLKFEDYRFKDREEFMAMKTSGELPFGQVPALLVDGNMLIQSAAILRCLRALFGGQGEGVVLGTGVSSFLRLS